MSTPGTATSYNPRRRSPRLSQAIPIQIAGKDAEGKVFVESTMTYEISRHGASLSTRASFEVGAAMAIRREDAPPVRARVKFAKPGKEPGLTLVGVEFVGDEGYWEWDFPKEWQDASRAPLSAETEEKLAAAERRVRALEGSLEAVVRKAETLRGQAESVLEECAKDLQAAREKNAAALAAQMDTLATRAGSLEEKITAQARAAGSSLSAQAESATVGLTRRLGGVQEKLTSFSSQIESAVETGRTKWAQTAFEQEHKTAALSAQLAEQVESQRKALAEMQREVSAVREQMTAQTAGFVQEIERQLQSARGELRALSAGIARDVRQQLPELGQEASRFLAAAVAEQQAAASQFAAQSLESFRASIAEFERNIRDGLQQTAQKALTQSTAALEEALQQGRTRADVISTALDTRLERARVSAAELGDSAGRTLEAARQEFTEVRTLAEEQLRGAALDRIAEVNQAAAQGVEELKRQQDSIHAATLDARRQLDQATRELQTASTSLGENARQKRAELDALFASLMERYDARKEALDRVLELLENGRTALRADLDSIRTGTEGNLARLQRFTGEQEATLRSRTTELEQKLQASAIGVERELQERATRSLEGLHQTFSSGLERSAAEAGNAFYAVLKDSLQQGSARVSELRSSLDQSAVKLQQTLEAVAGASLQRIGKAQEEIGKQAAAAGQSVAKALADAEAALKHSATVVMGEVEKRQADIAVTTAEMLAKVQAERAALVRDNSETENQMRQRLQNSEARFAALAAGLEERRVALEAFCAKLDQSKNDLAQSRSGLEQRVEESAASLQALQRELLTALDKRTSALTDQMRQALEKAQRASEQELGALGEATHGVFEARIRTASEQIVSGAHKQIESIGDSAALSLSHSLEESRREHELKMQELTRQSEEAIREELRKLQEFPQATAGRLNEQIGQMSRLAVERVREAHEMLLRDIPARIAEAELSFRQNLEAIVNQSRQDTATLLQNMATQVSAQAELDMRRRAYGALQGAPQNPNGE